MRAHTQQQTFLQTHLNMKFLDAEFWQGYLYGITGWAASFLVPTGPFLGIVIFLVFSDFVTGVRAAVKRGERLSSKGFRRTVEKILLYFIAILASEGMHRVFMPGVPITYMTALAIAVTEFKSNIENIETVTGVQIWASIKELVKAPFAKKQ
jgi:phage-related holin